MPPTARNIFFLFYNNLSPAVLHNYFNTNDESPRVYLSSSHTHIYDELDTLIDRYDHVCTYSSINNTASPRFDTVVVRFVSIDDSVKRLKNKKKKKFFLSADFDRRFRTSRRR